MIKDIHLYKMLLLKYRWQRSQCKNKRICYRDLRQLYKEMKEIYREYRGSYRYLWKAIQNVDEDPSAAQEATRIIDHYLQELEIIREAIHHKQKQLKAIQGNK